MAFRGIYRSAAMVSLGLLLGGLLLGCRTDDQTPSPWAAGGVGTFVPGDDGQGASTPSGTGGAGGAGCVHDAQCDDDDACTFDFCNNGACDHAAVDVDDQNACTLDACEPALGVTHLLVDPSDGDACTLDACDPELGIVHAPIDTDDANPCTIDGCDPVLGVTHLLVDPNDMNACTLDACDPQKGVSHAPVDPDDANPCTVDFCDATMGVFHTLVNPDDGNPCTADSCDPQSGVTHTPISCDDGNPCTADSCDAQKGCVHTTITYFNEPFSPGATGWSMGPGFQIGVAKASSGQSDTTPPFGADPAEDHSPSDDNGIAGVFIGGNVPLTENHSFRYLTSPAVDLSSVSGPVWLEFFHVLNSDYPPYMDASVEVYDGARWVTLYAVPFSGPPVKESAWTRSAYDVTPYKNAAFKVRFGYAVYSAEGAYFVGSWNIDDVRLVPGQSCPFP